MLDFIPEEVTWAILIFIIIYLLRVILTPKEIVVPPVRPKKPTYEKRDYSLSEIKKYDGNTTGEPIFIAIKNKIYDVSAKSSTYGAGGSYHLFSGNDATVCLAKSSFEQADINQPWSEESIKQLSADQQDTLNNWIQFFSERYPIVGNVKDENSVVDNDDKPKIEEVDEDEKKSN
ncbi:hypothetical protein CYY_002682 [Polysphondylium violaceum]|uniref:Cytochrome b5 heme-binding domain-containing protein n=1 Tax=Polysphondylium violaceum TaxID=133409 RepID=A0A8J4V6P0_9MYCE|nr:hypothetical protein CYY_002682 [Polysphondylium violaceum]